MDSLVQISHGFVSFSRILSLFLATLIVGCIVEFKGEVWCDHQPYKNDGRIREPYKNNDMGKDQREKFPEK